MVTNVLKLQYTNHTNGIFIVEIPVERASFNSVVDPKLIFFIRIPFFSAFWIRGILLALQKGTYGFSFRSNSKYSIFLTAKDFFIRNTGMLD
jgi:hypothetical protein